MGARVCRSVGARTKAAALRLLEAREEDTPPSAPLDSPSGIVAKNGRSSGDARRLGERCFVRFSRRKEGVGAFVADKEFGTRVTPTPACTCLEKCRRSHESCGSASVGGPRRGHATERA